MVVQSTDPSPKALLSANSAGEDAEVLLTDDDVLS